MQVRVLSPVIEKLRAAMGHRWNQLAVRDTVVASLSVTSTRGTYCKPLRSFLKKYFAACVYLWDYTKMSSSLPS